ncbi:hypothetical protein L3Q82_003899 [Scortum barcoo]|uniref:Uncharacterized protein n=1 Tax=Scortum barcoo TaxID=214431 RepID=A0ACB8X6H8_9TELE|nr:hypothetical protein L3Q82_003899 [Scortum barcoo]
MKVAFEEWRHWHVWTDHEDLQYLKSAKRLNFRQARWALFFSQFRFSLSYRPGSQNTKPDALSRLYQPEPAAKKPGAFFWQIEKDVQQASQSVLIPQPVVCTGSDALCSDPLGSCLAANMSPWCQENYVCCTEILVAESCQGCGRVHRRLLCLRQKQGVEADPDGASPATTGATQTMVTSITGLRHGSASVSRQRTTVHIQVLEGVLSAPRCHRQPLVRLPP